MIVQSGRLQAEGLEGELERNSMQKERLRRGFAGDMEMCGGGGAAYRGAGDAGDDGAGGANESKHGHGKLMLR